MMGMMCSMDQVGFYESAEKIISNALGLDKGQLDQMSYGFKLRYKYSPEEYIHKFSKK